MCIFAKSRDHEMIPDFRLSACTNFPVFSYWLLELFRRNCDVKTILSLLAGAETSMCTVPKSKLLTLSDCFLFC